MPPNPTEIRNWVIYKITNPNGRVYIGKSMNFVRRIAAYKDTSNKRQPLLRRSLNKYGFASHKTEIIDTFNSDTSFASGKEMFWIRSFMSNMCKYPELKGMNMTDGGEGTLGHKQSKEQIAKTIALHTGKKYCLGMKQPPELIEKRISKIRGRKASESERIKKKEICVALRGKPVVQFDLDGNIINEFRTIKETSEKLGVTRRTINLLLTGKTKRANYARRNFVFKYK